MTHSRSGRLNGASRRFLAALTGVLLGGAQLTPVLAQSAPSAPTAPMSTATRSSMNLDLSSTAASMAPSALGSGSVNIQVGGTSQAVSGTSTVTPAQQLAVLQILSTGKQSLQVGSLGNAVGGSFNLGSTFNYDVSNLVIPKGVTSISNAQSLNILGNLSNSGVLNVRSMINSPVFINATNIFNNVGGLITSNAALNLIATGQIINAGTIIGASNISLYGGTGIVNVGSAGTAAGLNPTLTASDAAKVPGFIQAAGNLNLITNNLVNSGVLSSTAGNINMLSSVSGSIAVNNTNGVMSALKGDVNVRDASFSGKHDFALYGGDVLSNNLNIWSGTGKVNVGINEVTGAINVSAGEAHVLASTSNLILGTMNILGDPTYFNTTGSITLNSAISTNGADLAIIAFGDILSAAGATTIDTTPSAVASGGNILMMAGTAFSVAPPPGAGPFNNPAGTTSGLQGLGDTTSTLTVTGASAIGGKVDFSATPITIVASGNNTGGSTNGGNVSIISFAGSNPNSGTVNLGTGTITSAGAVAGKGGNVAIIAGALTNPSVNLAAINTAAIDTSVPGGSGTSGGSILLATATPVVVGSFTILNGIVAPTAVINTSSVNPASISVGSLTTTKSTIIAVSGSNLILNGNIITGGAGGDIALYTGGNISGPTTTQVSTAGASGFAGRVLMVAGSTLQSNPVQLSLGAVGIPSQINTNLALSPVALAAGASINLPLANVSGAPVSLMAGSNLTVGPTISTNGVVPSGGGVTMIAGGNVVGGTTSITASGTTSASGGVIVVGGATGVMPTITQVFDSTTNVDTIQTSVSTGTLNPTSTVTVGGIAAANAPVVILSGSNVTVNGGISNTANAGTLHPILVSSGGNISLGGAVTTAGSDIGLYSRGSISGAAVSSVSALGTAGNAGNVLLSAGKATTTTMTQTYDFVTTVANVTASVSSSATAAPSPGSINLPAASVVGAPVMAIATGNVSLGGTGVGTTIQSNGSGNGGVTILASGSIAGPTGSITTTNGGATSTGTVTLVAGTKIDGSSFSLAYDSLTPVITTTTNLQSSGSLSPTSSVSVGGITTDGAPVTVVAGSNVALNGSITTNGLKTTAQRGPGGIVTVVAGGNITGSGTSISTDATGANNQGSNVLLLAGALSKPVVGQTFTNTPSAAESILASVNVSGASTGGNINLPSLATISTLGAAGGNASGNVTLAAFAGSTASSGMISMPLVAITTGGSLYAGVAPNPDNRNGDVTVLAGSTSGTSIALGSVNTSPTGASGVSMGAGNIIITTAGPASTGLPFIYTFNSQNITAPFNSTVGSFTPGSLQGGASAIIGNLTAAGGSALVQIGGVTVAPPTAIVVNIGKNLAIGSVINTNNALPSGGIPGTPTAAQSSSTISLVAGGVMTFGSGAVISSNASPAQDGLTANTANGVNGGSILISAQSFTMPTAVAVSANGTSGYFPGTTSYGGVDASGGNGGVIAITTTGTTNSSIIVGPSNFQLSAIGDATGGDGGTVSLNSGSSINITTGTTNLNVAPSLNPNSLSGFQTTVSTGTGGTLNLTAATTLFSSGTLDASGSASTLVGATGVPGGNGGRIVITVNSATPFNIGGAVAGPNGNGLASGGILSANGNLAAALIPIAGQPAFGSGGTIIVKNLNTGLGGTGGIIVATGSAIQVQAADATTGPLGTANVLYAGGQGGHITLQAASVLSQVSLNANGGARSAVYVGGSGGSIDITTSSNLPSNTFVVNPTAPATTKNGVIGTLSASGNIGSAVITGSGQASTLPSGSGGSITLTNTTGGITLAAGSSMSVAAAAAQAKLGSAGGDGGNIKLTAKGAVISAISLDASGGAEAVFTTTSVGSSGPGNFVTIPGIVDTSGLFLGQSVLVQSGTTYELPIIFTVPTGNSIDVSELLIAFLNPSLTTYFSSGNGGTISISSNASTSFTVNTTATPTNGVNGTLTANGFNGGIVSITNLAPSGGITVASGAISANSTSNTVLATPLINTAGNGGTIALQALGANSAVKVLGPLAVNGTSNPNPASSPATGPNFGGAGGNILITSNIFSPFIINAPTPTNIAPLLNGVVGILSANGGNGITIGGDAGAISVVNLTGGITSNLGAIGLAAGTTLHAPGNGGALSLQAPGASAQVLINGAINLNGGTTPDATYAQGVAGSIAITSNSFNAFKVGTATTNGSTGSLTAQGWNGGSITIVNLGTGGISVALNALSVAAQAGAVWQNQLTAGNGGNVSLQAPSGNVFITGGLDVSGGIQDTTGSYVFGGSGGQIGIVTNSATAFNIGFPTVNGAGSLSANGTNGGVIYVSNFGTGGIIVSQTLAPVPVVSVGLESIDYYCQSCSSSTSISSGSGGKIYLQAGKANGATGNVFIAATLTADGFHAGVGTGGPDFKGNGGVIAITTNSATAFNVGSAPAPNTNLPFNNSNGVATGAILSANGFNGGSVGIKNLGAGSGGIILLPSAISVSAADGATATLADQTAGNGGNIDLQAPAGTLAYLTGTLSADSAVSTGGHITSSGGTITLNAKVIKANTVGASLALSAIGDTTSTYAGKGGSVFITQTSTINTLSVGNNGLIIRVQGSPGSPVPSSSCPFCITTGGTIMVTAPGGIIVSGKLNTYDTSADKNNLSGSITLSATGTVGITGDSSGKIYTGSLIMNTGTGGIGTLGTGNVVNYLNTRVLNLTATSAGTTGCINCGNIFVQNNGDDPVIVLSATTQIGTINIKSDSGIIVAGPVTSALSTTLQTTDDSGTGNIVLNGAVLAQSVKVDAAGQVLNALFVPTPAGTVPDFYNWMLMPGVTGFYVGERIQLSGQMIDPSNPSTNIDVTEVQTIIGIDALNNNILLSGVTNLYNSPPLVSSAPGTGTGLLSATGVNTSVVGVTVNAGSAGVGSALSPIETSAGLVTLNVTGNGTTTAFLNNSGNVLFSAGSTSNLAKLVVSATGSLSTLGAITTANTLTLRTSVNNDAASIILGGVTGAGTASSVVNIQAGGSIVQTAAANVIQGNAITLSSENGNVGMLTRSISATNVYTPTGTPLFVSATPSGLGAGTLSVSTLAVITPLTNPGTVNITNTSARIDVTSINAGSDVLLSTTNLAAGGNLVVSGQITSKLGAITILNAGTSGSIQLNSSITASGGPLVVQNNNAATASIAVAPGTTLSGMGWVVDGVSVNVGTVALVKYPVGVALINGAFPTAPIVGVNPGNCSVPTIVQVGNTTIPVFYGTAGTLTAASTVTLNTGLTSIANAGSVAFQGAAAGAIDLQSGVIINSNSVVPVLSNLDLSNANPGSIKVIAALRALQLVPGSGVTGTLTTAGTGTVNFDTTAGYQPSMLSNLKVINIPGPTVVTLANFSGQAPIGVNTPTGTLNSVINGQIKFLGVTTPGGTPVANAFRSEGAVFVNSVVPGQVLTINPAAVLSSDNNLTINAGGSVTVLVGTLRAGTYSDLKLFTGSANPTVPIAQFNVGTIPGGQVTLIASNVSAGVVGNPSTITIRAASGILASSAAVTANDVNLTVGGSNYVATSAGLPLMIATSPLIFQGSTLAANLLSLNAGTTFVTTGAPARVNLNGQGLAGFNVRSVILNVDNSAVLLSQGSAIVLAGKTLGTLSATSNGPIFPGPAGAISTFGNLSCSSCTLSSFSLTNLNTISTSNPLGQITVSSPSGSMAVTQVKDLTSGSIVANNGLQITSLFQLTITGGSLTTTAGILGLVSSSQGIVISGANLTAGSFNGVPQNVLLKPSDIAGVGNLTVAAPLAVTINSGSSLQSIGGNLTLSGNAMNLGGQFQSNGGHILITATGNISGTTADFTANAVGTVATNSAGGGIHFASGSSPSFGLPVSLTNALTSAPGAVPYSPLFLQPSGVALPLGSNVNINNNVNGTVNYGTGAIVSNVTTGGTLNLGANVTYPTTLLNVSGGAVVFNVGGITSTQFDSSSFTTNALTPIKASRRIHATTEIVVDDNASSGDAHRLANVFVPTHSGAQVLTNKGILNAASTEATKSLPVKQGMSTVTLKSGTMLMHPLCDTTIHAGLVKVHAKKGAIVSVTIEGRAVRVVACSGPGNVAIGVAGKSFALAPGEEILVSESAVGADAHSKADGVGRRNFHSYAIGSGLHASICDISLVGLMANARHLQGLKNPQTAIERKIADSVLRSAAAVGMVTQSRGAYTALPAEKQNDDGLFTPVSYLK